MSKSSSSSQVQWRGSTRWKQGWSGSWKGRLLSDCSTRAESRADSRRARDDGLAHDAGSRAADDSHRPAALAEDAFRPIYVQKQRQCSLRGHGGPHPSEGTTRRGEASPRTEVRGGCRGRDNVQRPHHGHP